MKDFIHSCLFFLFLAYSLSTNADITTITTQKVGELWYVLNTTTLTASVTYASVDKSLNASYCSGDVEIPSEIIYDGKTYKVTMINVKAFSGCTGITSVKLTDNISQISHEAFDGCENLTSFTFKEGLNYIGSCAFRNCKELRTIIIPSTVEYLATDAFKDSGAQNLTINSPKIASTGYSLNFGNEFGNSLVKVTFGSAINSIGYNWFYASNNIETVILSEGITSVGTGAFAGCKNLKSVILPDNLSFLANNTFPRNTNLLVHKGSNACLSVWGAKRQAYDLTTNNGLLSPYFSFKEVGQTYAVIRVDPHVVATLSGYETCIARLPPNLYPTYPIYQLQETIRIDDLEPGQYIGYYDIYAKINDSEWIKIYEFDSDVYTKRYMRTQLDGTALSSTSAECHIYCKKEDAVLYGNNLTTF